jgi:nitroreductase
MDFYSVLKARHSVRAFEDKEVSEDKIEKIIGSFMLAPSAGNLQAYKVYYTKNPAVKKDLAIACMGQSPVEQASAVFVFCADKKQAESKYGERGYDFYSVQDATIATAYAQLSAAAEGLGAVWVGAFDPLEVSRLINAEPHVVPVSVLPVGYTAEEPGIRERRAVKDIVKEVK